MTAQGDLVEIRVMLTSGCAECARLLRNVRRSVEALGLKARVVPVDDVVEMLRYGIMRPPAIVVGSGPAHEVDESISPSAIERLLLAEIRLVEQPTVSG